MKQFYAILFALLVVVSCNNIKTDKTVQRLTKKTENLNALKKSGLQSNLAVLKKTASQDDTYKGKFEVASNVSAIAQTYFNYLEKVKTHVKGFKPNKGKEKTINSLQKEFFSSKDVTRQGLQFLDSLGNFKRQYLLVLNKEYPENEALLDSLFNIKPIKLVSNKEESWLSYQFKSVSNIQALANLTLIQSNILDVEANLMTTMMGDQQVNANAYRVDVVLEKTKYYPGDKVRGKLFISKSSENLLPTNVTVNDNEVGKENYKDGEVTISFNASKTIGKHPVEGELTIKKGNHDLTLYFNQSYAVVSKPKPVKHNKKPKAVTANTDNDDANNVINKAKSLGNLPVPIVSIRGVEANSRGVIRLTKSSFRLATIDVVFPNLDYKAEVTEFYFKPSNQPTIKIYGNKLTTRAISILNKSKRGRTFKIFNVKSKLKIKPSYRVKTPKTVSVEIIN